MKYDTPQEWKSEVWWRKRPVDERLFHLHLPPRIAAGLPGPRGQEVTWPLYSTLPAGVVISGPAASGKSLKAAGLLQSLVSNNEASGRWVEANDYVDMIKESFSNDGVLPEMFSTPHLLKYIKGGFDVLVLDGLGEEYKTDFASHELGSLIRKRFDRMKCTIITTQLSLPDIRNKYGDRLGVVLDEFELITTGGRRGR